MVSHHDGKLAVEDVPFAQNRSPLAGFSVIEADSIDEIIELVRHTPCPRGGGAIEIRAFWEAGPDGSLQPSSTKPA